MARRAAPAECNFSLCKLGADFIRFSLKLQNVLKPWDDVFFFFYFFAAFIFSMVFWILEESFHVFIHNLEILYIFFFW